MLMRLSMRNTLKVDQQHVESTRGLGNSSEVYCLLELNSLLEVLSIFAGALA